MAKVSFTAARVQGFRCPPDRAQAFLWDVGAVGLGLRRTVAGKPAYVFQSVFQGKDIRITIGSPDAWSIEQARTRARELQRQIDEGRDPRAVKAEIKAADVATRATARRVETRVGDAWSAYVADRKAHWGARHYQDHKDMAQAGGEKRTRSKALTIAAPLAEAMDLKLSELTSEWLERWASREAVTRPARARLALRLVKAFLKWCATMPEYRDAAQESAASSKRVREKLGSPKRMATVLQREQLPAWFSAVLALPNPVIRAYLQLMLLDGPRPNEPLSLRWTDIDFKWRIIVIRDKIEGDRQVPLTPYVASLIEALPRRNRWVFSSPLSESGRLVDPSTAHDAACDAAGLPRITLQGLRRSFASLCEWIEVPAGISAQIQGHAPQGVREQNYIRRPIDLLRMWHEKIEAWMLEHGGVPFTPQVQAQALRIVGK